MSSAPRRFRGFYVSRTTAALLLTEFAAALALVFEVCGFIMKASPTPVVDSRVFVELRQKSATKTFSFSSETLRTAPPGAAELGPLWSILLLTHVSSQRPVVFSAQDWFALFLRELARQQTFSHI